MEEQEAKTIQFISFDEKGNIGITAEARAFLESLPDETKLGNRVQKAC